MGLKLKTIAFVIALGLLYLFCLPHVFTACGDIPDHAMSQLRACPEAVELLGDDIGISYGITCGAGETGGGLERTNARIPVAGSKARGVYRYNGDKVGGHIRFQGQLTVGDRKVDIDACGATDAAASEEGSFDGRVERSTHPNVAAGSYCNGTYTLPQGQGPARLLIKCDGVVIYRGRPAARDQVADPDDPDDDQLTLSDGDTSDVDQSPALELSAHLSRPDGQAGSASVTDVAHGNQPAFEVEIAL
jgi:hypothetical protein